MRRTARSNHSIPPHNPGVRELIDNKRQWSSTMDREAAKSGFPGWHERGYLPHRDEPGLTQFVTFRLADSFPQSLISEWKHLSETEDRTTQRKRLEDYLDRGHGKCFLRRPDIARIVETALCLHHDVRYELKAWVIMANHVHVLFKVRSESMAAIVESWKKHSANKANRVLNRKGPFWAPSYFDTYMRNDEGEQKVVRYIENNPTKAKLVLNPKDWVWTSAKYRDSYGRLCI